MQLPAPGRWPGLPIRIFSALVLAPPVLAALYFGPPYSDILICIVAALVAWEWARLCGGEVLRLPGAVLITAVLAVSVAAALGFYSVASWVIATGAAAATLAATRIRPGEPFWYAIGVLYLGLAVLAFLWLRADPISGRAVILWLIAVVWATDVGAYVAGRSIGGPHLAPRISPGKTWAGLAGGMLAAMIAGLAVALVLGNTDYGPAGLGRIAAAGAALAVVAQVGDLFESHLKRRAGVKDSSHLIPGHGGVFDRVDGLLAAALALGGAERLTGGMGVAWL
ncbi:MAG: phosphatidate cytidylyltransferase [Alphaproteobacteria bacterium]